MTTAAPVEDAFARPRTRLHGLDASTTLEHFAIVTFDVDPDALAAALPRGLTPEIRTLDDGRRRGFISAVSFRDVDFRFALAPRIRRSFFQTNYRAYVFGPDGERSVFFFGTTLDSLFVAIPRHVWWMPWHGGATRIDADWDDDGRCISYRHSCRRSWGTAIALLEGSLEPAGRLDGFADADDAALVLTHPLDGWFRRPDDRLGRYSVWHERLTPQLGTASLVRYLVFERLGLVEEGQAPHSVLLQRSVEFDVHLPPVSPY